MSLSPYYRLMERLIGGLKHLNGSLSMYFPFANSTAAVCLF